MGCAFAAAITRLLLLATLLTDWLTSLPKTVTRASQQKRKERPGLLSLTLQHHNQRHQSLIEGVDLAQFGDLEAELGIEGGRIVGSVPPAAGRQWKGQ